MTGPVPSGPGRCAWVLDGRGGGEEVFHRSCSAVSSATTSGWSAETSACSPSLPGAGSGPIGTREIPWPMSVCSTASRCSRWPVSPSTLRSFHCEEVLRRHYATLEAVHSAEHSSYAYAVLPGADEEATRRAASDPGAEVVRNDEVAQAVRAGRLLAMNFWAAGRVQNVTAQGPACVLLRSAGRTRELSVSDPTHRQDTVSLHLAGTPHLRAHEAERVSVSRVRGGLEITVDTSGLGGRAVTFTLAP